MRLPIPGSISTFHVRTEHRLCAGLLRLRPLFLSFLLVTMAFPYGFLAAQMPSRIAQNFDPARVWVMPDHHPQWASSEFDAGALPADQPLDDLTLVLARSPRQELAFQQFLADQQNPASPDYHHWLTPDEVGVRYGLSNDDIATLTSWLQSQGLHVNWVSPSHIFIGFGGTAADIGHAFQSELHYYNVDHAQHISVSSDPMIPQALVPAIKAIHGLYTIEDHPANHLVSAQSASPGFTLSNGSHFITPGDFRTIYDLGSSYSGIGQTIGIVGRSRTNDYDFASFDDRITFGFQYPTEIVPIAFGGKDPGPARTAPPTGNVSIADQGEATLDVERAASVATNARVLLVVATSASGGIETDAQYLVQTSPVPAQIMSISFGECESAAGPTGVHFWDTLFQQAAAEGISTFVSSGDSGASGCDTAFATPPARPAHNSPNYICSSSYVTCVGGTEFNDFSNPSLYWNSTNDNFLNSARSYIPEGAWNEPLSSARNAQVAASGGGVSSIIPTPSWQKGTGVPAARTGRYTPDISLSASCHDAYFGCFAAGGGSCVLSSNSSFSFVGFCGTSAAAPSLAGAVAQLEEKLDKAQGNLNPELYQFAQSAPNLLHDVTVASSGVTNCQIDTPSMCNNSIPSPAGLSGGQAGNLVTKGYDEVTGLGSLDLQELFASYIGPKTTPTLSFSPWPSSRITTAETLYLRKS